MSSEVARRSQDLLRAGALDPANPDVLAATLTDEAHGVILKLWIRAGRDGNIEQARFKVFGCSTSIACLSLLAEHLEGSTIVEARVLDSAWLREMLALPEEKTYAADLVERLLAAIVRSWETKHG